MNPNFLPDAFTAHEVENCSSSTATPRVLKLSTEDEDIELPDLIDHHYSFQPSTSHQFDSTDQQQTCLYGQITQISLDHTDQKSTVSTTTQTSDLKEAEIRVKEEEQIVKTVALPQRKMVQSRLVEKKAPKVCMICGYPTTCLHYEASSCHACKTFYRRSCLSSAQYTCKISGRCDIKAGARCRSCRYDQCFRAGMDPESIRFIGPITAAHLAAIQVAKRRQIALMEADGKDCKWFACVEAGKKEPKVQLKFLPCFEQTVDSRAVDFISHLEGMYTLLRESTYTGQELYELTICDLLQSECRLGTYSKFERSIDCPPSLNEDKRPERPRKNWLIFDLILNLEYLKAMPYFCELDFSDKEALAMHLVIVNTVLAEAWFSYQKNFTTLVMPDGSLPITMRKAFHISDFYPSMQTIEFETFTRNLEPLFRVKPTYEEYCLIKAIIFCHAETPGLSQRAMDLLDAHRQVFCSALLRRIQARMGTVEGAKKFGELITLIESFFHFGQKHREFQVFVKYVCERAGNPRKLPSLTDWFIKNSSKFD